MFYPFQALLYNMESDLREGGIDGVCMGEFEREV